MDVKTALWTGGLLSAFGVILGFLLNSTSAAIRAQYERRGHWLALRADIIRTGTLASGYLAADVLVPTTRMPIRSYSANLPALLMAELLTEHDIESLSQFFGNADSFNRSLDYAQEALGAQQQNMMRDVDRARIKARKIAPGKDGAKTQYDEALSIVTRHIQARTGHRLLWWRK